MEVSHDVCKTPRLGYTGDIHRSPEAFELFSTLGYRSEVWNDFQKVFISSGVAMNMSVAGH